ncbi:MAG: hypothetical protein MUC92_10080 [Fimbriimonadaceae bacterium]|jgi:hypothetical protein|nr:hypothetical protein [Fimbriimonadaceae bacterium]
MTNKLLTLREASELINAGSCLFVAGEEKALSELPLGTWIGGTICYFIDAQAGIRETNRVFVTELPFTPQSVAIESYTDKTIHTIAKDGNDRDMTFLIVPGFSSVHERFATGAPEFEGMYMRPLLGWVAGVAVESIGKVSPRTFNGQTGESSTDLAVALRVEMPENIQAQIDIVNLFEQGNGPTILVDQEGFSVGTCWVNGTRTTLARFIESNKIDTRLPLVANFGGAMINTSIANVDPASETVELYSPVFPGVEYRFAKPVGDYAREFAAAMPHDLTATFSCNCILNYLYGELEGKHLPGPSGPITFGEIAYQLLNQTMVYLKFENAA